MTDMRVLVHTNNGRDELGWTRGPWQPDGLIYVMLDSGSGGNFRRGDVTPVTVEDKDKPRSGFAK